MNFKYEAILETIRINASDILIFAENNFPYLFEDNQGMLTLKNNLTLTVYLQLIYFLMIYNLYQKNIFIDQFRKNHYLMQMLDRKSNSFIMVMMEI